MQPETEVQQKPQPATNKESPVGPKEPENKDPPVQEDLKVEVSNVELEGHDVNEPDSELTELLCGETYQRHFYLLIHYTQSLCHYQYEILCIFSQMQAADGEMVERAWFNRMGKGDGGRPDEVDEREIFDEDLEGMPELMELMECSD
ncbi:hypothetical protein V5O48_007116 [Marasmius crinis-equi]|uniref:Uncharacterized protein n=1 Tax=Marasmius crinis-equi TaxID=585013 RepID=A0ABR3FI25_9AGAR